MPRPRPSPDDGPWRVQLALSPLVRLPGLRAFHSSVLVEGREFWFSPEGLCYGRGEGVLSHRNALAEGETPIFLELGDSPRSGQELAEALGPFFKPGTYDILRKNCNAFTDCAIFYLLQRRMSSHYLVLDRLALVLPSVAKLLMGSGYVPNPTAADFDLEALITKLGALVPEHHSQGFGNHPNIWASWLSKCQRLAKPELCISLDGPFTAYCPANKAPGSESVIIQTASGAVHSASEEKEVIDTVDGDRTYFLSSEAYSNCVQRPEPDGRLHDQRPMPAPEVAHRDADQRNLGGKPYAQSPPVHQIALVTEAPRPIPQTWTPRRHGSAEGETPRLWSSGDEHTPRTSGQLSLPPELLHRLAAGTSIDAPPSGRSRGIPGGGLGDELPLSARAAYFKPTLGAAAEAAEVPEVRYGAVDEESDEDLVDQGHVSSHGGFKL